MERSTCVSAAKLTIASQPAAARETASGSAMSPTDELAVDAVEVLLPAGVGELVEHDHDLSPPATSRLTKWLPMNPQPPVTSTRTP